MRRYIYIASLLFAIPVPGGEAAPAPGDVQPARELQFDVTCGNRTYKVGEPVDFTIVGNAQEIHFYSGERGSRYQFRNEGETINIKKVRVSFESQLSNLKTTPHRWVMISNDFDGQQRNQASFEAATWTDITFRFTLPANNDMTRSGWVDLTRYAKKGPFCFAFRYINEPYKISARPPSWRIYSFRIWGVLDNGEEVTLGDISATPRSAGFVAYDFQAADGLGYNRVGPNYLRMEPADKPAPLEFHEVWMTTRAIDGSRISLPAEVGVVLQCPCRQPVREHQHTFAAAGQYSAVFVGIDPATGEQIVKTLAITVK